MLLGAVADHAVCGVHRLVDRGAGQPRDREPEGGRGHAVGKVLGQALDRRPRDAGFIKHGSVAPDDLRHRLSARLDTVSLKRVSDVAHVSAQAALRDQRAGEDRRCNKPDIGAEQPLDRRRDSAGERHEQDERRHARETAAPGRHLRAIEFGIQQRDQAADPRDRMADGAVDALRITDRQLEEHRHDC